MLLFIYFVVVNDIGVANVTSLHPLVENGYLLFIIDEQLVIGKVISMFKLIGNRHAYVDSIESLSYISVITFIRITEGLFSQEHELQGGNIPNLHK